jgi:hypothetical protein
MPPCRVGRLEHRTEKHGPAKAGLRSGFRENPMLKQKTRAALLIPIKSPPL